MNSTLMSDSAADLLSDSATSAALQAAQLDTLPDPIAQASGVSVTSQNMASAKKKLESAVRDLTLSVDNQTLLLRAAQSELSEIDQKVGVLQSRIAMAKVKNSLFRKIQIKLK